MRKSFVVLVLLVGAAAMLATSALAQEGGGDQDQGFRLSSPRALQLDLTKASRLRTSADSDTFWVGHSESVTPTADNPFAIGQSPYRPGTSNNGVWDFDSYNGGLVDSLQGWTPIVRPNTRTSGTRPDTDRPWFCLDWGNRLNTTPVQGRTVGIVGVWHSDGGNLAPANGQVLSASPMWTPLAGNASAWCGLRAGKDVAVLDDVSRGGTGNPINGDCLWGEYWNGTNYTAKLFPGYAHRWDQMLYRDVRVAAGGSLTVSFLYQTHMDPRCDNAAATGAGWFNLDPLSVVEGGSPVNFVSNSNSLGRSGPIDSFMVYVGVPTDPEAVFYSDDNIDARPIYDPLRRWFSEVLKIDAPYYEILSTWGQDSVYKSTPFSATIDDATLAPLLAVQGAADGGGVIRIVFRSKTNRNFGDEAGTGGSYNSGTQGAVRIDDVAITGCTPAFTTSGFETAGEIDNQIESANTSLPGPAVGAGYALNYWKSTGKPPKIYAHTHPIFGGDIDPGPGENNYSPLAWADICGAPDSPNRLCNVAGVVVSYGDHQNNEAAGGGAGTPFRENVNGIMSPAINLVTPATGVNNMGIDRVHAMTTDDWYVRYDAYLGIFNIYEQGNIWGHWLVNYPTVQANGAQVWGDLISPTAVAYNPEIMCYWTGESIKGLVRTSNPSGLPDSIRLVIIREQRCISFGVTDGCSPTGGFYIDNVSFFLPPPVAGAADKIEVDIWDWYGDAFPANETTGLPGTGVAFDTCGAWVFTGSNKAPNTNDELRFSVPGDTVLVKTQNADAQPARLDCIFRVYPGPGNYVTVGNKTSGLRVVPTSTTMATPGDGSFWGEYMLDPGVFNKGTHIAGWNVDTWNSVRIDTVEQNLFPVDGRTGNLSNLRDGYFATTIHESEPKYSTLGILKNRCFLIDTSSTGELNSNNITCSYVPAWLLDPLIAQRAGFNGAQKTREFTKVFPDGLLTPGSHVEYFFRMSKLTAPTTFVMCPDTNMIYPQSGTDDGQRWQEFGVLPDRWKAAEYGGIGNACMLFVDGVDRRGGERVFVGLADSIGLTKAAKYGAHNGWHCTGAYIASDGSHDYTYETDCGTNPNIAVWSHGGMPGSLWDMYGHKAAESASSGCMSIGSRLANRAGMGFLEGKSDRHGPTPEMLRTYYKMIFWYSGGLNATLLGPFANRSNNDVALLEDFLSYNASVESPRGMWIMGDGFIESEDWQDTGPHTMFVTNYLACSLRDRSYFALQGMAPVTQIDLTPTSVITTGGEVYSLHNGCLSTYDVLTVNSGVSGATAGSYYEPIGLNAPYVSGVYAPATTGHPFITLVDGWLMGSMFSHGNGNTVGRLQYFVNVLVNTFGSICPFVPELTVDVPTNTVRNVDFLGNVWGNPMVAGGKATVHFGLAKADRVEIKVYDVTGRLVKSLADRTFAAGEHTLVWDGTDDQGRVAERGVYFVRVDYPGSRFEGARKLVLLR